MCSALNGPAERPASPSAAQHTSIKIKQINFADDEESRKSNPGHGKHIALHFNAILEIKLESTTNRHENERPIEHRRSNDTTPAELIFVFFILNGGGRDEKMVII